MLTVGYLIPEWPGQTHLWIWREISHLRERGVKVRIFATQRQEREMYRARHGFAAEAERETTYLWPMGWWRVLGSLVAGFLSSPVGFLRCLAMRMPKSWRLIVPACYLAREVRRGGVGHLHSHSPANCTVLCMMVKRLTGVSFSQVVNANLDWWGGGMREKLADASFSLLVTQRLVEEVWRAFPELAAEKYGLGRVGVDTKRWTPVDGARDGSGPLRVLSVGRLTPGKGHHHLIRAIKILKDEGRRVLLRIGGDGPEMENLRGLVEELRLSEEVTLLGSLAEEVYLEEMRGADVFALASDAEPMGVVYMEAMACGKPAIGTAAGGVGEVIADGVDGLLVPPADPEALAGAIGRLIDEPDLRRRLGEAGRRKVVSEFDSRKWAGVLWERICAAHSGAFASEVGKPVVSDVKG